MHTGAWNAWNVFIHDLYIYSTAWLQKLPCIILARDFAKLYTLLRSYVRSHWECQPLKQAGNVWALHDLSVWFLYFPQAFQLCLQVDVGCTITDRDRVTTNMQKILCNQLCLNSWNFEFTSIHELSLCFSSGGFGSLGWRTIAKSKERARPEIPLNGWNGWGPVTHMGKLGLQVKKPPVCRTKFEAIMPARNPIGMERQPPLLCRAPAKPNDKSHRPGIAHGDLKNSWRIMSLFRSHFPQFHMVIQLLESNNTLKK